MSAGDRLRYAGNFALRPLERLLVARHRRRPAPPVVFVVGLPRSGTTLVYQLAVRFLEVGWVGNRVARYWMAPITGSILRRARRADRRAVGLDSSLGNTEGPHGPHEFSWFWRQRFGPMASDDPTAEERQRIDWQRIAGELEALAAWWRLPLVLKSLPFTTYTVGRLAAAMPGARFVDVRRDPVFVCQSLLAARRRLYADERRWWSVRPRDFTEWLDRDPIEQVCHQVADARRALDRQLAALPDERVRRVDYGRLTSEPAPVLRRLAAFAGAGIADPDGLDRLRLDSSDRPREPAERLAQIEERLRQAGLAGSRRGS